MGHLETGSAGLTIHKPPLFIDQILMKVVDIMSKWSEALELAKAGFKAGEIREMWEEKDKEPKDPEPKDPEPKDPEPKNPEPKDPEPKDPEPKDPEPKDPEPKDDKYKELEKKYDELLKATQQKNTKKDISDNDDQKSIEEKGYEILADMWR